MKKTNAITPLVAPMAAVPYDTATFAKLGVKKIYIFDFDGVINPEDARRSYPATHYSCDVAIRIANKNYDRDKITAKRHSGSGLKIVAPKAFDVRWSNDLITHINTLAADPEAVVIFLSTWLEDMGTVTDALGLAGYRPFYYLPWDFDPNNASNHLPKIDALVSFLGSNTCDSDLKVVWVDDSLFCDTDGTIPGDHVIYDCIAPDNLLFICPRSDFGLSRAEIEAIADFMGKPTRNPFMPDVDTDDPFPYRAGKVRSGYPGWSNGMKNVYDPRTPEELNTRTTKVNNLIERLAQMGEDKSADAEKSDE